MGMFLVIDIWILFLKWYGYKWKFVRFFVGNYIDCGSLVMIKWMIMLKVENEFFV